MKMPWGNNPSDDGEDEEEEIIETKKTNKEIDEEIKVDFPFSRPTSPKHLEAFTTKMGLTLDLDYKTLIKSTQRSYSSGQLNVYFKNEQYLTALTDYINKRMYAYKISKESPKEIAENYKKMLSSARLKLDANIKVMPHIDMWDKMMAIVLKFYMNNEYPLPEDAAGFLDVFYKTDGVNRYIILYVKDVADAAQLSLQLKDVAEIID